MRNNRYDCARTGLMIMLLAFTWAMSSCNLTRRMTFWKPQEIETRAEVLQSRHYLVVPLAGPEVHPETARRVALAFKAQLASKGQRGTLLDEIDASAFVRHQQVKQFERLFHDPAAIREELVKDCAHQAGAERVVTCRVLEYGELWRQDTRIKRLVLQAACDDIEQETRLAQAEVVTERAGPRPAFSDVEHLAAQKLLLELWPKMNTARITPQTAPADQGPQQREPVSCPLER